MDSLGALALATGTPSPELLNRPPQRKKEYIISRKMIKHIVGQAIH
jgi:magnesium-transporting ATPase (P-type)